MIALMAAALKKKLKANLNQNLLRQLLKTSPTKGKLNEFLKDS